MKDLLAASRYANALVEISRLTHEDQVIETELESFSTALKKSPELEEFFKNPQLSLEQKRKFLMRIYQDRNHEIYETLLNFFMILFEKQRFYLIHEIAVSFKKIADEARGQGMAEIQTAVPLDSQSESAIISRLEAMAGYKIRVKKEIDPALIGGVVVKLNNQILDGSIRNRLHLLTKELTKIKAV